MRTAEERFWEKVGEHSDPDACWLWQAGTTHPGNLNPRYGEFRYGTLKVHHKMVLAHRFAYELLVGPIPEGLTLDHVKARGCTSTLCVNPAHLEPVPLKVNLLRGVGSPAVNAKKLICKHGHPFDEENTYRYSSGRRNCRTCDRIAHREHYTPRRNNVPMPA